MSLELVPLVADWMGDPTYGVNALLTRLPHDPWDDLAPPIVVIADETRDGWVARGGCPTTVLATGHVIAVQQTEDATWAPVAQRDAAGGSVQAGTASVVLLYLTRKSDTMTAQKYAKDILRAMRWSLLLLFDPSNTAYRQRNGVQLTACTGLRQPSVEGERGDALVSGALIASYETREVAPLITP